MGEGWVSAPMKYSSFGKIRHLEGFLFGTSVFGLVLLIFAIVTDSQIRNTVIQHLPEMITALGSLIAAYLAVKGISHQVQSKIEIETSRRKSQLEAAKASLPLALSELHDACRSAIRFTYQTDRHADGVVEGSKAFAMSESALAILKECISYSDAKSAVRLANVIRHYQVSYSRTVSSYEEPTVIQAQFTNTFDWAVVLLLVEDCYEFARGISETIPAKITKGSLSSVFWFFNGIEFSANQRFMNDLTWRTDRGDLEFLWESTRPAE